jgi:hypothetical protein
VAVEDYLREHTHEPSRRADKEGWYLWRREYFDAIHDVTQHLCTGGTKAQQVKAYPRFNG